jgi:PKD repeat protein
MQSNVVATLSVIDFRGSTTSLSSYNLPITPLLFSADIAQSYSSGARLVWYFGDGETSTETSPSHYYQTPGVYKVNLFVYNQFNQANLATIGIDVVIKDYLEDTFTVEAAGNPLKLFALNGRPTQALTITQTLPARVVTSATSTVSTTELVTEVVQPNDFTPRSFRPEAQINVSRVVVTEPTIPSKQLIESRSSIQYRVSGSQTTNYFYLTPNKYNHLEAWNSILKLQYVPSLGGYEYVPVSKIQIPLVAVYGRVVDNDILTSTAQDNSSILLGYSGQDVFYYKDDFPTSNFTLEFSKPTQDFTNPLSIKLNGEIGSNRDVNQITVTSCGIDGDGGVATNFDISKNKFYGGRIHFICRVKDDDGFPIKNVDKLTLNHPITGINVIVKQNNTTLTYPVCSLQDTLAHFKGGGFFRGYVEIPQGSTTPLSSIYISSQILNLSNINGESLIGVDNLLSEDSLDMLTEDDNVFLLEYSSDTLQGDSNTFTVYPHNYYTLYKHGEEFDGEQMYKDLRFQETLLDKDIFFTDFLGSIFGDETSDVEALGKKVYERIRNFLDNTTNINTNEIIRLLSVGDMVGYQSTVFDNNLANFPNKVQRIVSILSIAKNKLFGEDNKFIENFNSFGFTTKDKYGKNLGDLIDTQSYTISSTHNIVAYEKFSKTYKLLNTYQPLCAEVAPSSTTYMLSDYNDTWGWPLLLPTGASYLDIPVYYDLYEFAPGFEGEIKGGILNFDLTTVNYNTSYNELVQSDGIYDNIILDTLYQALSITK